MNYLLSDHWSEAIPNLSRIIQAKSNRGSMPS